MTLIWYYILVFLATFIVDLVPFFGPPAWTVMVILQIKFDLNVWFVLVIGVTGSTFGRYFLSRYIPYFSHKYIKVQKNEDLEYIGKKLEANGWAIQLFVLFYTLLPLPSTPLFTAAGIAKIRSMHIIPAFFIGKFVSDMVMVFTGDYFAHNAKSIGHGFVSWQSVGGTILGVIILCLLMFIDWRMLLQHKKLTFTFKIWK